MGVAPAAPIAADPGSLVEFVALREPLEPPPRLERALVCVRAEPLDELRGAVDCRLVAVRWRVVEWRVAVLVDPEPSEVVDGVLVVGVVAGSFLVVPLFTGRSVFAFGAGAWVVVCVCGA